MVFKKLKLILGAVVGIFCIFLMSSNTFAVDITYINAEQHYRRLSPNGEWGLVTQGGGSLPYRIVSYNGDYFAMASLNFSALAPQTQTGTYFSGSASFVLTTGSDQSPGGLITGGYSCENLNRVIVAPEQGTRVSQDFSVKSCRVEKFGDHQNFYIIIAGSGKLQTSTQVTSFYVSLSSNESSPLLAVSGTPSIYAWIAARSLNVDLTITEDASTEGLGKINDSINYQTQVIERQIEEDREYYDKQYDAVDNIDNQSTSDIQGATNSQTTSIIGAIQNFATALGTVTTSPSGTCELTLPFPEFVGGSVTVNVCQKRGQIAQIIAVGSSLLLIGFFIPFAYLALKMIYNEIRSWTNG